MADEREKMQYRSALSHFETREDQEDKGKYIEGYFSVFNSNYELWEGATESVDPHAFDETLDNDIRCLINHDSTLVLGRNKAGTLELRVDEHGLWGRVKINPNDQDAVNLYERVKRGDVDQCSFGFQILKESTATDEDKIHWTLERVALHEVSVCTFPAYESTSVAARMKDAKEIRERQLDNLKTQLLNKIRKENNDA